MALRPKAARWFELVTVRKDLAQVMECLSRSAAVELEAQSGRAERLAFPELEKELQAHHELARHYQGYWPAAVATQRREGEPLNQTLSSARERLKAWAAKADPIIAATERLSREIGNVDQLNASLTHAGNDLPDLRLLAGAGPALQVRLVRLAPETKLREVPALVLFKTWDAPTAKYVLLVGRRADIGAIEAQLAALKASVIPLPAWLPPSTEAASTVIAQRRNELARDRQASEDQLAALSEELQIASALGDMGRLEWLSQHAKDLRGSERLAWVTGWTNDPSGKTLRHALDAENVRYVVRMAEQPAGLNAPMVLSNPSWVRGFEVFARMLGTPTRDESDPSVILAVIVPLIFGYMFGDVGQGLVVLAVGVALGPRVALLRMLVPAGVMAIGFGLLFGSVFCREDLIPALWLHPLREPMTILIAAVAGGVVVLSIGLLLDAVQAHWRGEGHRWWSSRVGLLIAYFGLLSAPFQLAGLAVAAAGATWFIIGSGALAERGRLAALVRAAGEFVEEGLRLLVNTISFARVGAFALAHAGLSAAIVELAAATGRIGFWLVLALGNVLVVALEGLVVTIQTTRLMLFEFFVRFLTGKGREFKPLAPPDFATTHLSQASPGGTP